LKGIAMPVRIGVLLLACFLTTASNRCFGQDAESPDSNLTREQWQQRVEDARRRAEEFVANARTQAPPPLPPPEAVDKEAANRAMNDPSLKQGDIVATGKGFVVFVGRDEVHKPDDFVSEPNRQHPR
jgi:hypothetical protein